SGARAGSDPGSGTSLDIVRRLGLAGAAGDLFCDGSFGSHTPALSAPYADAPGSTGHLWPDGGELAGHILARTRAGVQAGFHAIGNAALRTVLEAMAKAAGQVGLDALVAARHRIEHAEMPPADGIADLAGPGGSGSGAFAVGGPAGITDPGR